MRLFAKTEHPVVALAYLDGGKLLVGLERFGGLWLWDAATRAVKDRAQATGHQPHYLATHADGRRFATTSMLISSRPTTAQLWTASRGRFSGSDLPKACDLHGPVAFMDEATLVGGGKSFLDGRRQLVSRVNSWDLDQNKAGPELAGHRGLVNAVVAWPDGTRAASAGSDGWVRVWDVAAAKLLATRKVATGVGVLRLAVSPDGRRVAATVAKGADFVVMELVGKKLNLLHELSGHRDWVTALGFGPEGRLATAGRDGQFLLWPPDGPAPRVVATGLPDPECLTFSPDGRAVAVGCDDGVRLVKDFPAD